MEINELKEGDRLLLPNGREYKYTKKVLKEFFFFQRINPARRDAASLHCNDVWLERHKEHLVQKENLLEGILTGGVKLFQGAPGHEDRYTYMGYFNNYHYVLLDKDFTQPASQFADGTPACYSDKVLREVFKLYPESPNRG